MQQGTGGHHEPQQSTVCEHERGFSSTEWAEGEEFEGDGEGGEDEILQVIGTYGYERLDFSLSIRVGAEC